ncbi:MAG: asparagine synthetase B [Candidatus Thorarchaeota archaeon]|nr:MAG: asparagine synthetase B [Candidatus Thorarchaeota archaeon]
MPGIVGLVDTHTSNKLRPRFRRMSDSLGHRGSETDYAFEMKGRVVALIAERSSDDHRIDSITSEDSLFLIDAPCYIVEDAAPKLDWVKNSHGVLAISLDQEGLNIERSPDCTRPLYYSMDGTAYGFASEKKALYAGGFDDLISPLPGARVALSWTGELTLVDRLERKIPQVQREKPTRDLVDSLRDTLLDSIKHLPRGQRYGVLFSGGVDSSVIAHLLRNSFDGTKFYTVGTADSHDFATSEKAARLMDITPVYLEIETEAIWDAIGDVVYSIETTRRMDVEIALPFFFAARCAVQDGCTILVSGQGPDELFAGYMRHVRLAESDGILALERKLWEEVSVTHESNIARDEKAIAFNGIEAAFPYLSTQFVNLALSIPAEMKVSLDRKPSRKIIFRELAESLGLPLPITQEPKKATQYSSGSSKALIEAFGRYAPECQGMSKKEIDPIVQSILDRIGIDVGVQKRTENR